MREALYYNEEENIIATVYYLNGIFISSSKQMVINYNVPVEEYDLILKTLFQKYTFIGYL